MTGRHGSPEARFRRYAVERAPDECWEWAGARSTRGYGELSMPGRRPAKAHQMAWEAVNGPVPDGLWVLHHCDNPPCINPAHLYVGTHADNMRDMRERGRHWYRVNPDNVIRGERCGAAKLTADQVAAIRVLGTQGVTHRAIGVRFGVSRTAIGYILNGRTWRERQQLTLGVAS